MAWAEIKRDDAKGLDEFAELMHSVHPSYSALTGEDMAKVIDSNKECEVWIERDAKMGFVMRLHQVHLKTHILMVCIQPDMDLDVGLKYVCQVMADYQSRHGNLDMLAIVPKEGCLPHMKAFYDHCTSNIPGSAQDRETPKANHLALPKAGIDEVKDAVVDGEIK